jgi:hypothetical protein
MGSRTKKKVSIAMVAVFAMTLALALAPSGATAGACPLAIVKCGCTISKSGTYTLAGASPMKSGAGTCVDIKVSNVTLSGVGTLIQGPGANTSAIGVHVDIHAKRGVILESVEAKNFSQGILIEGTNVTVQDGATSFNNKGTVVNGVHALLIEQSSYRDGAAGIEVNDTAKNFGMMAGMATEATGAGIELNGVRGAFLSSIVANDNVNFGIWLKNASDNLISGFESEDNGIAGVYLGCNAAGPNGKACPFDSNRNTLISSEFRGDDAIVSYTGGVLLLQSYGIAVGLGSLGNHFISINGMGNITDDALDENPACGSNRWLFNFFSTSSPKPNTTLTCINY